MCGACHLHVKATPAYEPGTCNEESEPSECGSKLAEADCRVGGIVGDFVQKVCPAMCGECTSSTTATTTSVTSTAAKYTEPAVVTSDDGTCAYKGYFELTHTLDSQMRFKNSFDPAFLLMHDIAPAAMSNTTLEQFAAKCLCKCQAELGCVAGAIRNSLTKYNCILLSQTGGSVATTLDMKSYTKVTVPQTMSCRASSPADPHGLISMLNTYYAPLPDLSWSSLHDEAAIISKTVQLEISNHMVFEAKVRCLNLCCAAPLCQAAYIEQSSTMARCSLLTYRGSPIPSNGNSSSLMYRRQYVV